MKNIQESLGELTKFLNFESTAVPTLVGSQKVNVCFLKTNNVFIELIEPAEENSPISSFTANGGGFHHLCEQAAPGLVGGALGAELCCRAIGATGATAGRLSAYLLERCALRQPNCAHAVHSGGGLAVGLSPVFRLEGV